MPCVYVGITAIYSRKGQAGKDGHEENEHSETGPRRVDLPGRRAIRTANSGPGFLLWPRGCGPWRIWLT
jgi:hypothetical protein